MTPAPDAHAPPAPAPAASAERPLAERVMAVAAPARLEALLAAACPPTLDPTESVRLRAHADGKAAGLRDLADALGAPEDEEELFRSLAAFWLEHRFEWERFNQTSAYQLLRAGVEPPDTVVAGAAIASGMLAWVEEIVPVSQLQELGDVTLALLDRIRPDVEAGRLTPHAAHPAVGAS